MHKCLECDREFKMPAHLGRHIQTTHKLKQSAIITQSQAKPSLNKNIFNYQKTLDQWRPDPADNLDAVKLARLIKNSDQGIINSLLELNESIESRDAHILAVANTRRQALTGLPWEIISASNDKNDNKLADEAAQRVREKLDSLPDFDGNLQHLSFAIGPNLSVSELIWESMDLVDIYNIPNSRLNIAYELSPDVRIITQDNWRGVPADYRKFIVHIPTKRAGCELKTTLTRACAFLYLIKNFSVKDWASFCEIYGMPFRVGKVANNTPREDIDNLFDQLTNLGTDGAAVIDENVNIQFIESNSRGVSPYQNLAEYVDRKISILYLGQNLTTENSSTGSYAMAMVHERVRLDILEHDIRSESKTINQQLIKPLIEVWYPNKNVPMPKFKRSVTERRNVEEGRLNIERIRIAKELGLEISNDDLYKLLDLPKPENVIEELAVS